MENHKIRVAITQGDTNGIGYELIFKTFAEPEMLELCTPIIYGSPKIAAYHSHALQTECQFSIISNACEALDGRVNLLTCFDEEVKVEFGQKTTESKTAALKAVDRALADSREGLFDVLVCGPMEKDMVEIDGIRCKNAINFIETSVGGGHKVQQIYMNDALRVVLANCGSVREVNISQDIIEEKVKMLHKTLRRDFRVSSPRIAVLALNPTESAEEKNILCPAVEALAEAGIQAFGPYQADTFFEGRQYEQFDAVVAMYHDQGILPLRMLSDTGSVVALTNIPLVCTMPDTDARMDIAGKNEADETQMRNAIYAAIDICRHREEYDLPLENPLPKLYHERPDNGEKLRFAIPKKKDE